ncbi:MAG: LapA family protein [Bellilinea sp.]
MMSILLVLALVIAIIAVIFALQNTAAVTVSFFFWQFHESLALVLLLTVILGVLIGILTILPGSIRSKWRISSQRKKVDILEKALQAEKAQHEEAVRQLELLKNPPAPEPELPSHETQATVPPIPLPPA